MKSFLQAWGRGAASAAIGLGIWAAGLALVAAPSAAMAQSESITEDSIIDGTMSIDFNTRTTHDTSGDLKEGSASLGAKDRYSFTLSVAKTTQFIGEITRQPNLYSKVLHRLKQPAQIAFKTDLFVLNPKDFKQKKNVGAWVGTIPIDTATGAYDLAGGRAQESPLRIDVNAVGSAKAFKDHFEGRLMGKAEQKDGSGSV